MRIYVIAGNADEFGRYVLKRNYDNDYFNVVNRHQIKEKNPSGVFIGTWQENPDIDNIIEELFLLCYDPVKRDAIIDVRLKLIQYRIIKQ